MFKLFKEHDFYEIKKQCKCTRGHQIKNHTYIRIYDFHSWRGISTLILANLMLASSFSRRAIDYETFKIPSPQNVFHIKS